MDLRLFIGGFIICLNSYGAVSSTDYNCRLCKPGFYASRMCSANHDTVCKPCPNGSFTNRSNTLSQCIPCSTCPSRHVISIECSMRTDTICESCETADEKRARDYFEVCFSEVSHFDLKDSPGITLTEKHPSVDVYELESSSVPDGSGVFENVDINVYPIINGTDEDEDIRSEIVGSGLTDSASDIINLTTTVIIPDDDKDINSILNETTTVKAGILIPEGGITLENTTESKIEDPAEDKPSVVDVYIEDTNVPKTGASQTQKGNADGNGASVGVVVTVGLVTAFVFFVLGFLASRVWNGRRERTFNVMEAERRNGKRSVECSGIEYKDPENNISKPGYGQNGTDPKPSHAFKNMEQGPPIYKKPAQKTSATPPNAAAAAAPKPDEMAGNWAGFAITRNSSSGSLILNTSTESSAIKYIDEGSDNENETHKLLPSDSASDSKATSQNGIQATPPTTPVSAADQDENTPMLPKDDNMTR